MGLVRYDQWGLPMVVGRLRNYSAPVNSRYVRRVASLVSWREVLEVSGYRITNRNRGNGNYLAGIRHDAKLGEVFYIRCVFHDERSASMCLLPWGFHCFGCGTDGTIVDFIAGLNHLFSAQAIKRYIVDTFPQMRESALIPK